jgi:diphthamide biosynthesis protein 2
MQGGSEARIIVQLSYPVALTAVLGDEDASTRPAAASSSAVALRNQDSSVAKLSDSAAAMYLQERTYMGLETKVGQDEPSVLEQGRSGVARVYASE